MDKNDKLTVWHENRRVGVLKDTGNLAWDAEDDMAFEYDDQWCSDGFPISQSLPMGQSPAQSGEDAPRRFFANLLPEGDERLLVVRELRISDRDFRLLEALGGECAGALSLLPPGIAPNRSADRYERISEDDIYDMAKRQSLPRRMMGGRRPRFSLAGAQPKVAVMVRHGQMYIPNGDAPSTHILKFEHPRFEDASVVEAFIMRLAKVCGLRSSRVELIDAGGLPCLLVERYDRTIDSKGRIKRLHQEDFCQALGRSSRRKYEAEGGVSLLDCAAVLRTASAHADDDCKQLVQWQVFNVLCGNADGHAKNLSLLYTEGHQPRLAPFYDLLSTHAFSGIATGLAFAVNGVFDPDRIARDDWKAMSEACGVGDDFAIQSVVRMTERLLDCVEAVRADFVEEYGHDDAVTRVAGIVTRQCNHHRRIATHEGHSGGVALNTLSY